MVRREGLWTSCSERASAHAPARSVRHRGLRTHGPARSWGCVALRAISVLKEDGNPQPRQHGSDLDCDGSVPSGSLGKCLIQWL